jgi:hypothetical protein
MHGQRRVTLKIRTPPYSDHAAHGFSTINE